jgi:4-amino-4-deoxy-L-arabinose transferase-like glycosyltransferase
VRLALVLAWPFVAYAFVVSGRAWIPVGYIVGGALALRLNELLGYGGSDVLDATFEAIGVFLGGASPYGHTYTMTRPPGQPMPYPPAALLLHLPGYLLAGKLGVFINEAVFGGLTLALLGGLAARVSWTLGLPALAVYATLGNMVYTSADGSNDTSTGAVLLLAVIATAWAWDRGWDGRRVAIAGLAAALALATKQTTLFVVLLLAIAVWQMAGRRVATRYLGVGAALLLAISVPFLWLGPVEYLRGLVAFTGVHVDVYGWNIWTFARNLHLPVLDPEPAAIVNILLTLGSLAVVLRHRISSLVQATFFGTLVTLVLFLTARWESVSYFAMIAPLILALPLLAVWSARGPGTSVASTPPAEPTPTLPTSAEPATEPA